MWKFIGKSNEQILHKLNKSKILRLYSIIHVAMGTAKTSHFTCQSKSLISIFFSCQILACGLQPFSCHDLANDIYSQTAKTVFSHLNNGNYSVQSPPKIFHFMLTLGPLTASQNTSFGNAQKFLEHPCFDNIQTFRHFDNICKSSGKSSEIFGSYWDVSRKYMPVKTRQKISHIWPKMLVCVNEWASEGQPAEAFSLGGWHSTVNRLTLGFGFWKINSCY